MKDLSDFFFHCVDPRHSEFYAFMWGGILMLVVDWALND